MEGSFLQQQKGISVTTVVEANRKAPRGKEDPRVAGRIVTYPLVTSHCPFCYHRMDTTLAEKKCRDIAAFYEPVGKILSKICTGEFYLC